MKSIGIFILIIVTLGSCRTSNVSKCPSVAATATYGTFAQATPNRDTLYLVEKDPMALITKKVWDEDTSMVKPAIILVSSQEMDCIKKRCNGQIKELN